MGYLRVDLKVCEGCGALWIRNGLDAGVYCRGCAARLKEFPAPRRRRSTRVREAGQRRRMGCAEAKGGAQ